MSAAHRQAPTRGGRRRRSRHSRPRPPGRVTAIAIATTSLVAVAATAAGYSVLAAPSTPVGAAPLDAPPRAVVSTPPAAIDDGPGGTSLPTTSYTPDHTTPTPTPVATPQQVRARVQPESPATPVLKRTGRFVVAGGKPAVPVPSKPKLFTYTVEVEQGIPVNPAVLA